MDAAAGVVARGGVVEGVCAARAAALGEGTRVGRDLDGGAVIGGRGVCDKGVGGEGGRRREVDCEIGCARGAAAGGRLLENGLVHESSVCWR